MVIRSSGLDGPLARDASQWLVSGTLARGFKAFHAVGEMLFAVDIDICGIRFRIICVYMPHSDGADIYLEQVYTELDRVCDNGKRLNRK